MQPNFDRAKVKEAYKKYPERREMRFTKEALQLMLINAKRRGLSVAAYTRYLLDYALREDTVRLVNERRIIEAASAHISKEDNK